MGLAMDTILAKVTNTSGAISTATVAPTNSATVRSFAAPATCKLENIIMKGAAAATVRVRSPLMHDDVRGLQVTSAQAPLTYELPPDVGQPLNSQDTLDLAASSGATDSTAFAITTYYSDLTGASANLKSLGDIGGVIEQMKLLEVDVTASATVGQWNDTVITTTEQLLKANRWYAVLGYIVDVACLAVAISGTDTSNLRVAGPGTVLADVSGDYFVEASNRHGTPHIPVFNSANQGTTFVSVADNAASTAVKVQLVLALLSTAYTG